MLHEADAMPTNDHWIEVRTRESHELDALQIREWPRIAAVCRALQCDEKTRNPGQSQLESFLESRSVLGWACRHDHCLNRPSTV